MTLQELQKQVLQLPMNDRWQLVQTVLESIQQETISPHLQSTYKLIQNAFPKGIESPSYLPLLSLLSEEMSDRNLAIIKDGTESIA